jgi:hypothetical protein
MNELFRIRVSARFLDQAPFHAIGCELVLSTNESVLDILVDRIIE